MTVHDIYVEEQGSRSYLAIVGLRGSKDARGILFVVYAGGEELAFLLSPRGKGLNALVTVAPPRWARVAPFTWRE